jgi:hypothetical protein
METAVKELEAIYASGKYYETIDKADDVMNLFAGEASVVEKARSLQQKARQAIKARLQPHLEAGAKAMAEGNYSLAQAEFRKALAVESYNRQARAGLDKIRDIMHDRSRKIFTEALVAESISDYRTARAKFKECFDSAVQEDKFYGMCERKYKRYNGLDRTTAGSESPTEVPGASDPKPPSMPSAPAASDPTPPSDPAPPAPPASEPPPSSGGGGGW